MTGTIFDIKKFALFDGPGIRTTVFLSGCPLNCWWCQNPEGLLELPEKAPSVSDQFGTNFKGEKVSAKFLVGEIKKDAIFYDESNGGVTFSGGEPLLQALFLKEVLAMCKQEGLHTVVDTSGYAPWPAFEMINPFVDLYLYDIKIMEDFDHIKFTGTSNELIFENLQKLLLKNKVLIRIPLIPEITDTKKNLVQIKDFIAKNPRITSVELLPFNHYSKTKYKRFKISSRLKNLKKQTSQELEQMAFIFKDLYTTVQVKS